MVWIKILVLVATLMDGDGLDGDGNHFGRHKPPIDTIKVDGNVFMAP